MAVILQAAKILAQVLVVGGIGAVCVLMVIEAVNEFNQTKKGKK